MDTSAYPLSSSRFPIADALAHGVLLHRDGRIMFANQAFSRLTGYAPDELVELDFWTLFPPGLKEQVCGQGQAGAAPARYETLLQLRGGEARWVELTLAQKEIQGADTTLCSLIDITERRRAREALSQVHAELKAQFELSTTELQQAKARLEDDLARREAAELELLKRYAELTELNCLLHDTQQQLVQSEKLASIGQLAAGVAHEINNPIGYVRSNIGSLQDYVTRLFEVLDAYQAEEAALPEAARANINKAKQAADFDYLRDDIQDLIRESAEGTERVRKIVQDLRDFSRSDTGQQWQAADLHQGLESTLNIASNEIKYRADVVREYGQLPLVECLPSQLNQVFMNLFVERGPGDSRRASRHPAHPHRPRRRAGLDRDRGQRLRHRPRGPGPHLRPLLHHQAGGQGHRPRAGPVLRHHPETPRHDHRQQHPRQRNHLPHHPPRASTCRVRKPSMTATPTSPAEAAAFTILCVDDEPNILSALRRLFRPQGYAVRVANGGVEGLAVLDAEQVDLIISDMRMPGMDGAAFLAEARKRQPDAVRLLLTGYADMGSTIDAINGGQIARYISKPWNDQDVLLTVREALERQRPPEREDPPRSPHQGPERRAEQPSTPASNRRSRRAPPSCERPREAQAELPDLDPGVLQPHRAARGRHRLGHSRRVADVARKLAVKLGLKPNDVQDVMLAGLLHDVGKIGLPDELLAKPAVPHERRRTGDLAQAPHRRPERPDGPGEHCARRATVHPQPPRALGRPGLPGPPVGAGHPVWRADHRGGQRLRRAAGRAVLAAPPQAGGGHRLDPAEPRQTLLPPGGGRLPRGDGRERPGLAGVATRSSTAPSGRAWCWPATW